MGRNVTQKLIEDHLVEGTAEPGRPLAISIDQTLTQDATGTLVMLTLAAFGLDRVRVGTAVQYVDHNITQADNKNPDDHLFLESAARRFGLWYSRPGNGVSHPVHMQLFGRPGLTLLGSDSHTCAAGSLGMLAIGAGGINVAAAMAGELFHLTMPKVLGIRLEGRLPDWVSAKDVILEVLRRRDVDGGRGYIVEYYGPGLAGLSAMDRHVIANMGAELGATTTVFPSDEETRRFLESEGRGDQWREIVADEDASYDEHETVDLSGLVPLIAKPSSPGNVVPVSEVAGEEIYQAYIGSSANPGYRDFAMPALMVEGCMVPSHVSFDINPTSRQLLAALVRDGHLARLIQAGARLHQAGCNGCIGMGQAPATGRNSLRTVPRNFPGRSGTKEDCVFLCSPETATASALMGRITDPRELGMDYPRVEIPGPPRMHEQMMVAPLKGDTTRVELVKGPGIVALPAFGPLPERLELPVMLKVGDDISTDEIMPAGARVLPYRSNIPAISQFAFEVVDETYIERVEALGDDTNHAVVGGDNYGQGSSREHAAIAPRYLGLRAVLARSFARIHHENLVAYGVLPLAFDDPDDYDRIGRDAVIVLDDLHEAIGEGTVVATLRPSGAPIRLRLSLWPREVEILRAGGYINWFRERAATDPTATPAAE